MNEFSLLTIKLLLVLCCAVVINESRRERLSPESEIPTNGWLTVTQILSNETLEYPFRV